MPGPTIGDCNCHCEQCPGSGNSAAGDAPDYPAHVSDPAQYRLGYDPTGDTLALTVEAIAANVTASSSVIADGRGDLQPGSRRVTIQVTGAAGKWAAGVILWMDDPGMTYDPSIGGSISRLLARGSMRWVDEPFAQTDNQPALIFGAAIEQDGQRYVYDQRAQIRQVVGGSGVDSTSLPADTCWHMITGDASDGMWPHYFSRWWTEEESTVNGGPCPANERFTVEGPPRQTGLSQDKLGTLNDSSGEWDFDARPDLSLNRDSIPVTRFGIAILLTSLNSEVAGDFTCDMLIDELLLELTTWGVLKLATAELGSAPDFGSDVVDEPLDTLPGTSGSVIGPGGPPTEPGWQYNSTPYDNNGDDILHQGIGGGSGAEFEIVNGAMETPLLGSADEYQSGVVYYQWTGAPDINDITDNFQIRIDCTLHFQSLTDVCDSDALSNPELPHQARCGFFVGNLVRVWAGRSAFDRGGWQVWSPCFYDGGNADVSTPHYADSFDSPYCSTAQICPVECALAARVSDFEVEQTSPVVPGGSGTAFASMGPSSGDRYTLLIRRTYTQAEIVAIQQNISFRNENDIPVPCDLLYPERKFSTWLFINGRLVVGNQAALTSGTAGSKAATQNIICWPDWPYDNSGWRIGLIALWGGRWSDWRVRCKN